MQTITIFIFFFSSRRRHTRSKRDWSSDVCSSDLLLGALGGRCRARGGERLVQVLLEVAHQPLGLLLEIGRASCRERAWITLIAGTLKTTAKKTTKRQRLHSNYK